MMNVQPSKIGQIAIAVSDVKRSISFYQDCLGLSLLFEAPPSLAFFQCGETRLMVTELQGDTRDHHTSVIYYQVDDIQAYVEQIKGKGCVLERDPQMTARMPDHELWIAFLRDPDDNLLGIMSEVAI